MQSVGPEGIELIIREMAPAAIEETARVTREILQDAWKKFERGFYPEVALDFDISRHSAEELLKDLETENRFCFVAEDGGRIVGLASGMWYGDAGMGRLGTLGVHPEYQRRGIGRALLNRAVEFCESKGCHKITLYTLPVLMPAVNLYMRTGFAPEAYLRREWWGVDFLKMSKWLR